MTIREILETVLNNYLQEKDKSFKNNEFAKLLRSGLKKAVSGDFLAGNIRTKGSAGQGNWATVPWIGVFDAAISTSATKGFDIVYLFSPDMSSVYLSLNQGWTFFNGTYGRNAKNNISKVSIYWQSTLANRTDRMTTKPIDLTSSLQNQNSLVSGYELGNIFSIKYDSDNLPDNDQLLTDLKDMLFCLNEIKADLINEKNLQQNIDYILSLDLNLNPLLNNNNIKKIAKKLPNIELTETDSVAKESDKKGRKIDYDTLQKQNSMIGFLGEQIVLKYEKDKLSDDLNLAQQIEHVSQTKGDGLGYDILSFDSQGNEIFIEVKTTTQGKNTPFYMSSNEVSFANKHPDNYFLYRVYNFSNLVEMNNIEFFKINGSQMKNIDLQPVNFIANINYIE
ncbi:DUF3578 domain-containing protein [Leuconostoc gasicomitatum]|uniref:MrcB family domain-containing protein n=1 Tax=Leuconostoc gasicomitatum TaxID=115778 RepID=UPI000BD0938F|nr:DUF3578 domain-containing protein [Leuconostoc gasicomitatum]MBZ5944510.1 DUF3578 domain-containing protein [Leuconostoc gasicomitatum]MBZ5946581.1 DUF3578 domain-containing protein [Leuconostoc gasicomitatum]MBZ5967865.1 DUF3578 domain-containing protein [Leuconostoc gasicomitatum]QFS14841.1 hypothetical protein BHS03_03925 [Leuconostoc gasicomitatum]SOC16961.1 conserved hypothetical protein [Leuconostoc gasicomitatum]